MIKNGETYGITRDHLDSARMAVDVATGQILQHIAYDEFEDVTEDANPGFQPLECATGLLRFRGRDYDLAMGKCTAKDPIGFGGGDTNLFNYTLSDPVNWIDPVGSDLIVIDPIFLEEPIDVYRGPIENDPIEDWAEYNPRWDPYYNPSPPKPHWYEWPWWPWNWQPWKWQWKPEPPHPPEPHHRECPL